ncbi:MAG: hypothetical protein EXS55_00695 [Candidatus Magasanikbacteria bacterium]|nr:hypothetical protein [Candidatus Magasanikbacteria bacterium]
MSKEQVLSYVEKKKLPPAVQRLALMLGLVGAFGGGEFHAQYERGKEAEQGQKYLEMLSDLPTVEKYKDGADELSKEAKKSVSAGEKAKAMGVLKDYSTWISSPQAVEIGRILSVVLEENEFTSVVDKSEVEVAIKSAWHNKE